MCLFLNLFSIKLFSMYVRIEKYRLIIVGLYWFLKLIKFNLINQFNQLFKFI